MSIQRLPGEVVAQIKSSITVTSLNGAVCGLLRNALDAEAQKVTVSVDYSSDSCVLEDDGTGIPSAEFEPEGGLGKLHHTSKYPRSARQHGRHGIFLASLASLSLLCIVSEHRPVGQASQNALTMHNGRVLRRNVPALPDQRLESVGRHGTRVTVRDLFGCMPVRARMRPAPRVSAWLRDWNELVRHVTSLLLAWPLPVVVVLRAESREHDGKAVGTGSGRVRWPAVTLRNSRSPETGGDADVLVSSTKRLLVQASLCDLSHAAAPWVRVESSVPGMTIRGCICLLPSASKQTQFLCLGVEPLSERHQVGVLYEEMNKLFDDSHFSATAGSEETRSATSKRPLTFASRRGVDRWPMFSLRIDLEDEPSAEVDDLLDDKRQHLGEIQALLRTMCVQFLKTHGWYDQEPRTGGLPRAASPTKKQKTKTGHQPGLSARTSQPGPFSSWPQIKSVKTREATAKATSPSYAPLTAGVDDVCGLEPSSSFASEQTRISRASLAAAKVIGQVDQKFILIKVPAAEKEGSSAEPVLVLVDQHAADERCRVEQLFRDYFETDTRGTKARIVPLVKPLQFELDGLERPLLETLQSYFYHWGVAYTLSAPDSGEATMLRVNGLPQSILERCRGDQKLVADLIRKEIWARQESSSSSLPPLPPLSLPDKSWVSQFHGCPRGILDLLNSIACHSATRFNDPLTREECCSLVQRLLQCQFPFQCAHGRPSMVPLLSLPPVPSDSPTLY